MLPPSIRLLEQVRNFMNTAESKIRKFFVPRGRSENHDARSYCMCGALKPQQLKATDSSAEQLSAGSTAKPYMQWLKSLWIGDRP
jgi:hypothetical protein